MEIIDEIESSKSDQRNPILLIGLGIFLYLLIAQFAYLFFAVAKDVLIEFEIKGIAILLILEIFRLTFILLMLILAIDKFKKPTKRETWYYLKNVIGVLIFSQVLQFFYVFYGHNIWGLDHYSKMNEYYTSLKDFPFSGAISSVFEIVSWIGIGFILFKNRFWTRSI